LDAAAKSKLLHIDAAEQMKLQVVRSALSEQSLYLVLQIRRATLVQDALTQVIRDTLICSRSQIIQTSITEFKKPLKVVFVGEEAIDEG
jgi:hypothetical protein